MTHFTVNATATGLVAVAHGRSGEGPVLVGMSDFADELGHFINGVRTTVRGLKDKTCAILLPSSQLRPNEAPKWAVSTEVDYCCQTVKAAVDLLHDAKTTKWFLPSAACDPHLAKLTNDPIDGMRWHPHAFTDVRSDSPLYDATHPSSSALRETRRRHTALACRVDAYVGTSVAFGRLCAI